MGNNFTDSLKGGFYQIPNSLWRHRVELGLTLEDIAIINCIAFHSKGWGINFSEELSDMSESTRTRKIRSLKQKGYLQTKRKVYESGEGFKCVGMVCDISALEEKLIELDERSQKEEKSNMTEKTDKTVKYDGINNTNNNNTNSEEESIFLSSLQERGLEVPKNIGGHLISSLSEREKEYLQFAGQYIEHEIEYGNWENKEGMPLYNSLHTILNPRRKTHFFNFCKERLFLKELEDEAAEKDRQMVERAKLQQENLMTLFDRGYMALEDFKDIVLNSRKIWVYYRGEEQLLVDMTNSIPYKTMEVKSAKFLKSSLSALYGESSLDSWYRMLFRYMGNNISAGDEFDFEGYLNKYQQKAV